MQHPGRTRTNETTHSFAALCSRAGKQHSRNECGFFFTPGTGRDGNDCECPNAASVRRLASHSRTAFPLDLIDFERHLFNGGSFSCTSYVCAAVAILVFSRGLRTKDDVKSGYEVGFFGEV